ncbi:hypothetical protein IWX47DRAFT_848992 [Phyllosticta citricarpa]
MLQHRTISAEATRTTHGALRERKQGLRVGRKTSEWTLRWGFAISAEPTSSNPIYVLDSDFVAVAAGAAARSCLTASVSANSRLCGAAQSQHAYEDFDNALALHPLERVQPSSTTAVSVGAMPADWAGAKVRPSVSTGSPPSARVIFLSNDDDNDADYDYDDDDDDYGSALSAGSTRLTPRTQPLSNHKTQPMGNCGTSLTAGKAD